MTGASTGIGRATAKHLADAGFEVYAGVRNAAARRELAALSAAITPVLLDVRNPEQVSALVETIEGLHPEVPLALVNNAGIGMVGPMELPAPEDWRAVLEVNVVGLVAVTSALLPSLLARRGRIVNVGSAAGRLALPLFGPYADSLATARSKS